MEYLTKLHDLINNEYDYEKYKDMNAFNLRHVVFSIAVDFVTDLTSKSVDEFHNDYILYMYAQNNGLDAEVIITFCNRGIISFPDIEKLIQTIQIPISSSLAKRWLRIYCLP